MIAKTQNVSTRQSEKNQVLPVKENPKIRLRHHKQESGKEGHDHAHDEAKAHKYDDVSVKSTKSNQSNVSQNKSQRSGVTIEKRIHIKCDDCVNRQIQRGHHQNRVKEKIDDRDFYGRLAASDDDHLHRDKLHKDRKLQGFVEARDEAQKHRNNLKIQEKELKAQEKQMLYKQFTDTTDLERISKEIQDKKEKHKDDLDKHYNQVKNRKEKDFVEDRKLAQNTHNLLIDDAWRKPHKEELKKYYYENLTKQVNDTNAWKQDKKLQDKGEDRNRLIEQQLIHDASERRNKEINVDKKRLFNEENAKAVEGIQKNREKDHQDNMKDRDILHQNLEKQNEIARTNRMKKAEQEYQTVEALKAQKGVNQIKRTNQYIEDHTHQLTGLHVPQKIREVVECDDCGQVKDLKQTNKVYAL